MKNDKTLEAIDLEKFNKSKENARKESDDLYAEDAEKILALANCSEEDLVNRYISYLNQAVKAIRNGISGHVSKKYLIDQMDALNDIHSRMNDCIEWLKGFKEIDISFIPSIRYKRMFANKTKEEIIVRLKEMHDIEARARGTDSTEEIILNSAVASYAPVRERVTAVRRMNTVESQKKLSIRKKVKQFFINLGYVAAEVSLPTMLIGIMSFVATRNLLGTAAVIGIAEAVGTTLGAGFAYAAEVYENHKIKKAGIKAQDDLQEIFTEDELGKMTR